jgi:hypothetical protein
MFEDPQRLNYALNDQSNAHDETKMQVVNLPSPNNTMAMNAAQYAAVVRGVHHLNNK